MLLGPRKLEGARTFGNAAGGDGGAYLECLVMASIRWCGFPAGDVDFVRCFLSTAVMMMAIRARCGRDNGRDCLHPR